MLSRFVISQVKHNSYFLVGVVIGLWVALATIPLDEEVVACSEASTAALSDEFEPQREERPLGPAGQAAGRSVQRPRYYSTELGIRAPLLAGVLSSEDALDNRVSALNKTAARLQPAFRVFIAASALQASSGRANVVGFTDTREMLKPFHALKYLADNYLEEYNFFFLVSDTSYVNARRLSELVSKLSISQDVYMGTVAEDDSHYCTLEGGILISNSVLRAVHGELDWCVRNSYSPHHHENIGRCVLHAAHQHCTPALQGEEYTSIRLENDSELPSKLADAVCAHPVADPAHLYRLHAYVSRVFLERDAAGVSRLRAQLARLHARHPRGFRNATWPAGLRADPGLAPPPPDSRFDHLRWTLFNESHAFMPDDHRAVASLTGAHKEALELVLRTARAWCLNRWSDSSSVRLVEGAWRWEPPHALRYRLLLERAGARLRSVEVVRALGAARLVAAPYVTETARLALLLPVDGARGLQDLRLFLGRYEAVCLAQDKNTQLIVVVVRSSGEDAASVDAAREAAGALAGRHHNAQIDVLSADVPPPTYMPDYAWGERLQKVALNMALPRLPKDALILLSVSHMEFNQDFLNRVRMNTIPGWQWYWAVAFARHAQYMHPRFRDATGARPQHHTGRFNPRHRHVVAFYRRDFDAGASEWRCGPELRRARAALGLCVLDDVLYAVGGFDGKEFLSCVEALTAADGEWTTLWARVAVPQLAALAQGEVALNMALPRLPKDALILLSVSHMEFNQDFLNRVRMNTIPGWQWYWAVAFARHAQYMHPRFRDATGARPQHHTGRFNPRHRHVVAFYRRDFDAAMASWAGSSDAPVVEILTSSPLRCLRAPDPALVLAPRAPPCRRRNATGAGFDAPACRRALADQHFAHLDLGDKHALAKLLLEERSLQTD